ncbi:SRSO17 transposase [Bradyrhizobium sp. USDA 4510]
MDAGYGNNSNLRTEISALGLTYVAGLLSSTTVWAPGTGPLPPKPWSGRGRPPKLMRRNRQHQPAAVKALAIGLPAKSWRTITWRQGTNEKLTSRFARVRVRAAPRDYWQTTRRAQEWLLIEWPKGEDQPTKYWLSTLPEDVAFRTLVETAKSNATIRTSSRRSGSVTSRDAAGAAFIITQRCALRPTDS